MTSVRETGVLTRERVLAFALVAATRLALYVCFQMTPPFLPSLAWALALAVTVALLDIWRQRTVGGAAADRNPEA